MTLIMTEGHRFTRRLELMQSFYLVKWFEVRKTLSVADYVWDMAAKNGCEYDK